MYLILGHARSGTHYLAELLTRNGIKIGRERWLIGGDGIAAWQMVVDDPKPIWECPPRPKGNHTIIHVVREPFRCIQSVMYTDQGSMGFRRRYVRIPHSVGKAEQAALSLLGWTNLIEDQDRKAVVRLESARDDLEAYFGHPLNGGDPGIVNARPHPNVSPGHIIKRLSAQTIARLRGYCATYGYQWPD